MTRHVYVFRDGVLKEVTAQAPQSPAPFVQQDSMPALKHPVTGEMIDSVSKWHKVTEAHGGRVVGNDLQSNYKHSYPEKVTEAVVMDRIERAEAIASDPTKLRARLNENIERFERWQRLVPKK